MKSYSIWNYLRLPCIHNENHKCEIVANYTSTLNLLLDMPLLRLQKKFLNYGAPFLVQ